MKLNPLEIPLTPVVADLLALEVGTQVIVRAPDGFWVFATIRAKNDKGVFLDCKPPKGSTVHEVTPEALATMDRLNRLMEVKRRIERLYDWTARTIVYDIPVEIIDVIESIPAVYFQEEPEAEDPWS